MNPSFLDRPLNYGFSGGEKKRNEILQMIVLDPELIMLDETDSGLDVDSFNITAGAIKEFCKLSGSSNMECPLLCGVGACVFRSSD